MIDNDYEYSIKNAERERRNSSVGRRIKVNSPAQKTPADWSNFLSNSENKQDLPDILFKEWSDDQIMITNTALFLDTKQCS